ncbi:MAG: TolB family protein [Gemmatimonadota bacterium]
MKLVCALALTASALHAQAPSTDIYLVPLAGAGARLSLGAKNVTHRVGYDNQPSWTARSDGFFYTANVDGQTDIYRYDLADARATRITDTPESEYSPTVMPDGKSVSVVRVERDSTQRLWAFPMAGGAPSLVLERIKPVGYHVWLAPDRLALFVLGAPATLQLADRETGNATVVAHHIGRTLLRVPGTKEFSFVQWEDSAATKGMVNLFDPVSGKQRPIAPLLPGNEFYTWAPDGTLLMGSGSVIYRWAASAGWQPVGDLASQGVTGISRMAVSPDGKWIAVVAAERATN